MIASSFPHFLNMLSSPLPQQHQPTLTRSWWQVNRSLLVMYSSNNISMFFVIYKVLNKSVLFVCYNSQTMQNTTSQNTDPPLIQQVPQQTLKQKFHHKYSFHHSSSPTSQSLLTVWSAVTSTTAVLPPASPCSQSGPAVTWNTQKICLTPRKLFPGCVLYAINGHTSGIFWSIR